MAPDDAVLAYMNLSLADRWAVERLLPPSERTSLQHRVRSRLYAEQRERQRTTNPAALLKCSPVLATYLVSVASGASTTSVTSQARAAVRSTIEQLTRAP